MFLPIVLIAPVDVLEEGMRLANDQIWFDRRFLGRMIARWFFDHTEAGVVYANRPLGSTTGAWPGYQPFGGWKGSGRAERTVVVCITCSFICMNRIAPSSTGSGYGLIASPLNREEVYQGCWSVMLHKIGWLYAGRFGLPGVDWIQLVD